MPVPTGTASLLDIQNEFGGSNPIGLDEYYGAADGIPSSGAISINDFRGKSAISVFTHTITTNQQELNLDTYLVSQGWNGTDAVEVTVNNGVYIWSDNRDSATSAALYVGSNNSYPSGLTLINKGYIMGRGGDGQKSTSVIDELSTVSRGRAAIRTAISFTISGISGAYIGGGGGGGVIAGATLKGTGGGGGGGAGGGRGGAGREVTTQNDILGGVGGSVGNIGSNGSGLAGGAGYGFGGGAGGGGGADQPAGGGGGGRVFPGTAGAPGNNNNTNYGGTGGFSNTRGIAPSVDFNSGYGGAGWGATSLDRDATYVGHPGGNAVQFTTSGKSITWAGDYANSTIFNNHVWGAVGL